MKGVRTVIVEDEELARESLRRGLQAVDWIDVVGQAGSGTAATDLIEEERPDLLFLDVRLPDVSGIDLLGMVRHQPLVIFTTAHEEYAVRAFEMGALDYLLKPFSVSTLHRVLDRHRGRMEAIPVRNPKPADYLFACRGDAVYPIPAARIVRAEAAENYTMVHAGGEAHLVPMLLAEVERRLDTRRFLRVHRSHLVGLDHIRLVRPYDPRRFLIVMADGTEVITSRSGTAAVRQLIRG